MTTIGNRPGMGLRQPPVVSPYLGAFDKLWNARTILLTQEEGQGPLVPAGGGDAGGGAALFPLAVRATYMDSTLIESGLSAMADLASMSAGERSRFGSDYQRTKASGDSIFIWVVLQTSATEDFLRLDRWTMFLENEDGVQTEPGRIVEHPLGRPAGGAAEPAPGTGEESGFVRSVRKEVELYFRPIPPGSAGKDGDSPRILRFVMLETKNPLVRAGGAWNISSGSITRGSR
jgi:hypothetical protein